MFNLFQYLSTPSLAPQRSPDSPAVLCRPTWHSLLGSLDHLCPHKKQRDKGVTMEWQWMVRFSSRYMQLIPWSSSSHRWSNAAQPPSRHTLRHGTHGTHGTPTLQQQAERKNIMVVISSCGIRNCFFCLSCAQAAASITKLETAVVCCCGGQKCLGPKETLGNKGTQLIKTIPNPSKLIHFMIFCDSFVRVLWNRARHVDLPGHLVAAHARHGISWSGCAGGSACVHWHCYRRWKSLAVTGIQCGTSWNCSSQRKMTQNDLWNWQKWDEMRWFHTIKPLTHPQKLWEICKRLHYS